MLITTAHEPTVEMLTRSKQLAIQLGYRWVARNKRSIAKLHNEYADPHIMIVTERELQYVHGNSPALFFHPSTALVRMKRLIRGESDVLMEICNVGSGDIILDCTAGLASDAIVFSHAAGQSGQVVALESDAILSLLLHEGLAHYSSDVPLLNEAMRRIRVQHTDHLDYLRLQPDRSVDIIYFDPMFRSPIDATSAMAPLREVANLAPLSILAVEQAYRVACKMVVMKEHRDSEEFARLGFIKQARSHSKIAYGVMKL